MNCQSLIKLLIITLAIIPPHIYAENLQAENTRPKVGLVMSGGGAKGVAHIGAIKVIEEIGLPIDYIAGTSMGSLIGALYSIGYTTTQLDSLVRSQDWGFLLSDKVSKELRSFETKENSGKYIISLPFNQRPKSAIGGGFVKGQNLYSLFSELTQGYHDSIDFNTLPIPYACVAENIVNGEEIVFRGGNLAFAMRASMSIPGAFEPLMHNGMALIDGGMVNNYPVSVAKDMGGDIIIGIDVQDELKSADELNDVQSVFGQLIALSCQSTSEEARKNTDVYIKVDVKGYSASSFSRNAIDSLLIRGSRAAINNYESLHQIKEKYFADYTSPKRDPKPGALSSYLVEKISFTGLDDIQKEDLMNMCDLYENTFITKEQIKETISFLYGTLFYSKVSYTLVQNNNGTYNLLFNLAERRENMINVGVRFDTEELAAVTLRTTYHINTTLPARIIFDGRMGKSSYASLAYSLNTSLISNISLSYRFFYNDINIYHNGKRTSNITYRNHKAGINYTRTLKRAFKLNLGADYEYYDYNNLLLSDKLPGSYYIEDEEFINYFASVKIDTTDDRVFPRSGIRAAVSGNMYTDNGYKYKDSKPFFAISANWSWAISPGRKFTVIPAVYARTLKGADDLPLVFSNCFGSNYPGRYVHQQLPFWGMGYTQIALNNIAIGSLTLRQRIYDNNFITIRGNIMGQSDQMVDFATGDLSFIYGGGISYSYRTLFGPIEAMLGYTDATKNPYFLFKFGFDF